MRSSVVVTSWWSNCLALTCLERLSAYAPGRELFVMQAGKSDTQMEKFRAFLPERVTELPYPAHIAADDSAMREYLARVALHGQEGVWTHSSLAEDLVALAWGELPGCNSQQHL